MSKKSRERTNTMITWNGTMITWNGMKMLVVSHVVPEQGCWAELSGPVVRVMTEKGTSGYVNLDELMEYYIEKYVAQEAEAAAEEDERPEPVETPEDSYGVSHRTHCCHWCLYYQLAPPALLHVCRISNKAVDALGFCNLFDIDYKRVDDKAV